MNWLPFLALAATLALLLLTERWIHRHLQGTMLLLTGDREIAVTLYALPLLPGILLHEASHALVAKLLNVRVGRISLQPELTERRIQLGFVPVEETDVVRSSLIGLAPLLAGNTVILLVGYHIFNIGAVHSALMSGSWDGLREGLRAVLRAPDLWVWAYLIFAVSNTMMPSRSDRQAWTPVILFLLLVAVLIWTVGWGPTFIDHLTHPFAVALRWLAMMYALTLAVDLPFILLITLMERLLGRLKGVRVEY